MFHRIWIPLTRMILQGKSHRLFLSNVAHLGIHIFHFLCWMLCLLGNLVNIFEFIHRKCNLLGILGKIVYPHHRIHQHHRWYNLYLSIRPGQHKLCKCLQLDKELQQDKYILISRHRILFILDRWTHRADSSHWRLFRQDRSSKLSWFDQSRHFLHIWGRLSFRYPSRKPDHK